MLLISFICTIIIRAMSKEAIVYLAKTIIPNVDRLVILSEEKEKQTKSGVMRSQNAKGEDETETGTVIAVGGDFVSDYGTKIPMRYKVGDRVIMDRFAGVRFRMGIDGKLLPHHHEIRDDLIAIRVLRQDAVLGILPKEWPV